MDFLAAIHARMVGFCGQNWKQTLGYSFALRSVKAYVPRMLLSIWLLCMDCGPRDHSACMAWPAVGTGQWPLGTNSAHFTVYRLRHTGTVVQLPGRLPDQFLTVWRSFVHRFRGARGQFLADRTNGRAFGTMSRLSVCLSVTFCRPIVAKRYFEG